MEAVKKYWFWGILLSILSIFAMSHNANAIDFTINFDDYSLRRNHEHPNIQLYWNSNTTTCNYSVECNVYDTSTTSKVKKLKTYAAYSAKANDIFILRVLIGNQADNGNYTSGSLYTQRNFTTNDDYLIYLGENIYTTSDRNFWSSLGYGPNSNEFYTQLSTVYQSFALHEYYFRALREGSYNIGFESLNYNSNAYNLFNLPNYSSSSGTLFSIISMTQYEAIESKENKEVEQKTQEAVDESQSAGGDSSTSAQTGTTGLLNAITGAVSVISSAQPTNCKINGNMGNLDIGQLDLCANPAPAFVQTIGSLILILMCVPLAISLFNRFIAIFRSFQS